MWSRTSLSSKGFTLIEILISVAIVSVVMVMIWQTTGQSIAAKKKVEMRDAVFHSARVAVAKMVMDIEQAVLLQGGQHLGQKQGSPLLKTVFKGESDQLHFTSLAHLRLFRDAPESEGCEIGYRLERDPESRDHYLLLRRESKWIDAQPEEGGVWVPLAKKVKEIKFDYWDGRQFDWKSSWNSESTEKDQLPRAVRIVLKLEHPLRPDEEWPFQTTVLIGMHNHAIAF